jgi:hypothetical protein
MRRIFIIGLLLWFFTDSILGQLVSGSVSFDNYDEPAVGTSVFVKGTNIGTVTDVEGNYTLKIDSTNKTLCFRYIGFESVDIEIKNDTILNVKLREEPKVFDDFLITAYVKRIKPSVYGLVNGQFEGPIKKAESTTTTKIIAIEKTWLDTTSLRDWIRTIFNNLNFPDSAIAIGIQGNVYAKFKIDNNGEMMDLEIIKGADAYLDKEVYDTLKSANKWTQSDLNRLAPIKGKYYTGIFILPVKFRIKEDEE